MPRYVSDAELPAFFRRADLLVLPHRRSTCPACCSPAWPSASRWCSRDVGGFRELVEEHGAGRLVAPGDPGALRAAIRELLSDPAERERLAERARAAAAGPFSWDRIAARTVELYDEVLDG